MFHWTAPRKIQWTFHFRACTACWRGRPVFAVEGGKNWPSTLRSPENVYYSHQKGNICHEESDLHCNWFPKRISSVLMMFWKHSGHSRQFEDKKFIFDINVLLKTIHRFTLADSSIRTSTSSPEVLLLNAEITQLLCICDGVKAKSTTRASLTIDAGLDDFLFFALHVCCPWWYISASLSEIKQVYLRALQSVCCGEPAQWTQLPFLSNYFGFHSSKLI